MALNKTRATRFGVDASYWRLGVINIHPRTKSIQIVLDGYMNQAAAASDRTPIDQVELTVPYGPAVADGGRAAIYAAVMNHEDWKDATQA